MQMTHATNQMMFTRTMVSGKFAWPHMSKVHPSDRSTVTSVTPKQTRVAALCQAMKHRRIVCSQTEEVNVLYRWQLECDVPCESAAD